MSADRPMTERRLTPGQREALLYFARFAEPNRAGVSLKPASVTALVAAGYLRKQPGSDNRYSLTEGGAALVERIRKENPA